MLTDDKSCIKSGRNNEYPNLESIYGLISIETRFHMQRVNIYSQILIQYIERNITFINSIERSFYAKSKEVFIYHDLGYAFVPLELFGKDEEIPEHVEFAKEAFQSVIYNELDDLTRKHAIECAVYHHERYDGTGYPEGLKGEEIPFVARICAIADMYDHLVTEEPYYLKDGNGAIAKKIIEESGKRFQPELVNVFETCIEKFRKQDIISERYLK